MKEYINKSNMNPDNLLINNKSILMMGIINATPDSFSGDGIYSDKSNFEILETCQSMIDAGVGIIDVGGESTRPKSIYNQVVEISEDEEIDRVIPLIKTIRKNFKIPISIDSKKTKVIKEAIKEICMTEIADLNKMNVNVKVHPNCINHNFVRLHVDIFHWHLCFIYIPHQCDACLLYMTHYNICGDTI